MRRTINAVAAQWHRAVRTLLDTSVHRMSEGASSSSVRVSVLRCGAIALCAATPLAAQVTVHGEVRDSLSGAVLVGAVVQLVPMATPWAAGLTTTSDSAGRFTITDVAPGRYAFGFQHARLATLGFDAVTRMLDIASARATLTANLALPGATTLRASLCGAARDTTGAIIGRVRDADTDTVAAATVVVVEWTELVFGAAGLRRSTQQMTSHVGRDGRYVLCDVPTDVTVQLRAVSADSASAVASGTLELRFPDSGPLMHRDLLVGHNRRVEAAADARALDDTVRADPARQSPTIRGTARLAGIVLETANAPVAGARVAILEAGAATAAGADGTFRLAELPAGSFAVQVVAIGFAPLRASADLRPDRETSVRLTVSRAAPMLDSVKVFSAMPTDRVGFAARRAKGLGYFIAADEIRRTGALTVAASLRMAPSLRSVGGVEAGGRGGCVPVIYLNGIFIDEKLSFEPSATTSIDNVAPVSQVGGIEVYANPADMPAQFSGPGGQRATGRGGCAAVVIWTKEFVPERP